MFIEFIQLIEDTIQIFLHGIHYFGNNCPFFSSFFRRSVIFQTDEDIFPRLFYFKYCREDPFDTKTNTTGSPNKHETWFKLLLRKNKKSFNT